MWIKNVSEKIKNISGLFDFLNGIAIVWNRNFHGHVIGFHFDVRIRNAHIIEYDEYYTQYINAKGCHSIMANFPNAWFFYAIYDPTWYAWSIIWPQFIMVRPNWAEGNFISIVITRKIKWKPTLFEYFFASKNFIHLFFGSLFHITWI